MAEKEKEAAAKSCVAQNATAHSENTAKKHLILNYHKRVLVLFFRTLYKLSSGDISRKLPFALQLSTSNL